LQAPEVFFSNRVLKNKHQAVSQGVRRFGKREPIEICEHLQKPHKAGSQREARFFNALLKIFWQWADGAIQRRWAKGPASGSVKGVPRREAPSAPLRIGNTDFKNLTPCR